MESDVFSEPIHCCSKIAQIRKRKASQPLQPTAKAKRARGDDILRSLREIYNTQTNQTRVMEQLCALQPPSPSPGSPSMYDNNNGPTTPPQASGTLQTFEGAFVSFIQSYHALDPNVRYSKVQTILEHATDECISIVMEMCKNFSAASSSKSTSVFVDNAATEASDWSGGPSPLFSLQASDALEFSLS